MPNKDHVLTKCYGVSEGVTAFDVLCKSGHVFTVVETTGHLEIWFQGLLWFQTDKNNNNNKAMQKRIDSLIGFLNDGGWG